jgi:hypothetical protein
VRETSFATPGGAPRRLWRSRHGYTGAEAARCAAIVIIVLAILAFLAWYVVPAFD